MYEAKLYHVSGERRDLIPTIEENAFKGIHKKAKVKVSKKKLKSYRKILKGVGINGKKQKITK
ncbi:MAG: hypothetical protein K6G76_03655 [Lachnospiraceae bacterium]|nr:hypothetical protein [Lachnospiraceae bacterium]